MTHSFTVPAADASETRANIMENVGIYQLYSTRARTKGAESVPSLNNPLSLHRTEFYFILLTDFCAAPKKTKKLAPHISFSIGALLH